MTIKNILFDLDPTDYEAWAYGLKKAGYATNIQYSQVLIKIIQTYKLQDYTLIAMGRMKETDRVLVFYTGPKHAPVSSDIVKEGPKEEIVIKHAYPKGEFTINNTKVIYVKETTPWLSLAEEYNIPLTRLWDFNDVEKGNDILERPQLVYLQRKRKVGATEFHVLAKGETLYDISQSEGIRFESLLQLNHLKENMQPAEGEKINLQFPAFDRPLLVTQGKNPSLAKGPQIGTPIARVDNNNNSNEPLATRVSQKEPQFTTHQVSTKETLYSISKRYGVELEKIKEWNRIDSLGLKIGQELIIYKNN